MKLDQKIPKVNDTPVYKWNFKKADWGKYAEAVERRLPKEYKNKSAKKMEKIGCKRFRPWISTPISVNKKMCGSSLFRCRLKSLI